MADQRTMTELFRAPSEGYAEAIMVPSILAEHFELKHSLINMITSDQFFGLEKNNLHDHILNQQTSVVTTAMTAILKQFQATLPPASIKAIEEICVTCSGAHPYYQCRMLKALLFNKEKLLELASTPLNENCSPVILKKLPEKLGDPRKFLILCGFSELKCKALANLDPSINWMTLSVWKKLDQRTKSTPLDENCSAVILKKLPEKLRDPEKFHIPCGFSGLKCKALADLGASINLMPLSVWKKLGLPELISTRTTLELANQAICTPAEIARDVFNLVGKFTFLADFVIVDYESDPRVPIILGRPFLRTARALIDVHEEEMILRDDLFATNHLSGNPTFSSHTDLTSPEVINPFSGSTTSSSPNHLLEEFTDELALITFPPGNYDLPFDIESDLREIEYLLSHDHIKEMDSILEDSIDEGSLTDPNDNLDDFDDDLFEIESDYDDAYNDPFDSKGEKIKESKLLIDELVPPRSSDFLPSPEYDSFLFEDFSEVDALPSTDNKDKVFNLGIPIHENLFEVTVQVTPNKNVKKISISHASLILENFNPPLYELPFHKEVPGSETLLSFSFENEEKISTLGFSLLKEFILLFS
nr:reverse transcriptase domain-containing protein [Tanacetum cinerariifolium]